MHWRVLPTSVGKASLERHPCIEFDCCKSNPVLFSFTKIHSHFNIQGADAEEFLRDQDIQFWCQR
jgi:hypothetical protein